MPEFILSSEPDILVCPKKSKGSESYLVALIGGVFRLCSDRCRDVWSLYSFPDLVDEIGPAYVIVKEFRD